MGAEWTSGLKFGEVALDRLEIVSGKLSRSSALALPTGSLLMRATRNQRIRSTDCPTLAEHDLMQAQDHGGSQMALTPVLSRYESTPRLTARSHTVGETIRAIGVSQRI
jgi:hypothetical protein